jgi:ubiquitin C
MTIKELVESYEKLKDKLPGVMKEFATSSLKLRLNKTMESLKMTKYVSIDDKLYKYDGTKKIKDIISDIYDNKNEYDVSINSKIISQNLRLYNFKSDVINLKVTKIELSDDIETYPIFIKNMYGVTVRCDVHENLYVQKLKELYCIKEDDNTPDDIRFIFAGKQLDNHHKLSSYRISEGATIHIVPRMSGGMFAEESGVIDYDKIISKGAGVIFQSVNKIVSDMNSEIMKSSDLVGDITYLLEHL